jgi:uncharacterized membrane protein YhfC
MTMNILYITYFLNGFFMIAMPIILAIILIRRWKLGWRLWLIGGATFILSQVAHIPFNYVAGQVLSPIFKTVPESSVYIFNAIFLGLSAGLFEELFRYGMFRWWAKDARSWRKGVMTGAGHGGFESIILGVLVLLAYVQLVALRNPTILAALPAGQVEAVQAQLTAYWSAPWYMTLIGAVERFFVIIIQISFAVIVLQTFTRKQWFWVWLAVLYHSIVDASAVLAVKNIGVYWTEAIVAGYVLISLVIIFVLRQPEPVEVLPSPVEPEIPAVEADL